MPTFTERTTFKPLAAGRFEWHLNGYFSRLYLWLMAEVSVVKLPSDESLSLEHTDKLILVQVMAWCRQTTSHYLSQCWPRSMAPQWRHNGEHPDVPIVCIHYSPHSAASRLGNYAMELNSLPNLRNNTISTISIVRAFPQNTVHALSPRRQNPLAQQHPVHLHVITNRIINVYSGSGNVIVLLISSNIWKEWKYLGTRVFLFSPLKEYSSETNYLCTHTL